MKIGIVPRPTKITPDTHGYGKRLYHLAEGLINLGHQVKIFAREDSELPKKCKIVKWQLPRKTEYPFQIEYMSQAIKAMQDCDIINCQTDHLALAFDKWSKVPILHTIIYGRLDQYIREYIEQNKKAKFLATSNFIKDCYSFLKFKGVVYNGIDIDSFPLSTKPRKDFFLYLSRISPDKQTHLAVEWAKKYKFKLYLAGEINDQEYFEKKIQPKLNKNIQYLGKIKFKPKIKYLQQAQATFMLDDYEGFGNSTIESLACGTPVIGFNAGSFPELISHKKDGYILESLDDIKKAIKFVKEINPEDCRRKAEKFNLEKMIKGYEKIYKKYANRGR